MRSSSDTSSSTSVVSKSAVLGIALVGTLLAFIIGAQAGALLNGRMMTQSVGNVPTSIMGSPGSSPVNTHVR